MSVAIDSSVEAQIRKDVYDAEFEADESEYLGPAEMCWLTCLLTGV